MRFDRNNVVNLPDVLPTIIPVAEVLTQDIDLSDLETNLMLRLQLGLPSDLCPIAILLGTELTRADYLSLRGAGIATASAINAADPALVLQALGGDKREAAGHPRGSEARLFLPRA